MRQFENLLAVLEGTNIQTVLKKEYPDVIFQLIGPSGPEDNENGYYRLQMIVVPFKLRQQKLGTKFMKSLIKLCKDQKHDIFLSPSTEYQEPVKDGGMTKSQVIKFYEKLGFEKKHRDDFRTQDTHCYYS